MSIKIYNSDARDESLRDLIDFIHFTEAVSTKIHGVVDRAEIYRIVTEAFAASQRYSASIFLLTEDRLRLTLKQTSLVSSHSLLASEPVTYREDDYAIDVARLSLSRAVVRDGSTIQAGATEAIAELFPQPFAARALATLCPWSNGSLLTPLMRQGSITGILFISSPGLTSHFICSAQSLARHLSTALELAEAHDEYHRAAQALSVSEARYRSLFDDALDSIDVGLFIIDSDLRVIWINHAISHYFGLDKKDVIGKNYRHLALDRIRNLIEDPDRFIQRLLFAGADTGAADSFECHIVPGKALTERWLEHRSQPIRSGSYAGGRIEHYYDITGRKKLEKQLIQQEKFAAIGRFTAGMAHEINNPLDILLSKIEYIQMDGTDPDMLADHLQEMKAQVLRISHITHSLLTHAGDFILNFASLDIHSVLDNALLLHRSLKTGKMITIETDYSGSLAPILGDSFALEKVFTNILRNAVDAIHGNGAIFIRSRMLGNDRIEVSFRDTGAGIPEEHLDKIFEPFFTTKSFSRGTGLGLFICRRIIKGHQGTIEVDSRVGEGATIIITLPTADPFRRLQLNTGA